ncbi:MAG TPA: Ig-like domain-containing protein, partial [Vicinamibacterales bacterium]|nr:Ig-like domain-containing protein [Vicinamibacterales bacterium]
MAAALAFTSLSAQIPGRNVNMVAGNVWPDGDPFLQRQNEPSIAASTRNPLHLLAGSNDYRTVDVPGLPTDEIGDAWLGLYKSLDGGQRWTSSLLPGYPQDTSAVGQASPIHGYGAGADPVVRAGTNGLIYYAGLAFDRTNPATPDIPGKSAIFVARFIDNNNKEAGDTFEYLGTRAMQTSRGGRNGDFLDKPWMVVDIPRDNSKCTIVTAGEKGPITQTIPAGPVYVAYTVRSTDKKGARYDIMFARSVDCGNSWSEPMRLNAEHERTSQGATMAIDPRNGNVHIAWRQFDLDGTSTDAMVVTKYTPTTKRVDTPGHAKKFAKVKKGKGRGINVHHFYQRGGVSAALEAAGLSPLDQATSAGMLRFRTNAYPSIVIDETGRIYMAWTERGYDPLDPDPVTGSARVLMSTSANGTTWTTPQPVASEGQRGHQLMPSIAYAGGKLMLIYYDIRETRAQAFTEYIDDRTAFAKPNQGATGLRHTIDLRASMASPGAVPQFAASVRVSDYLEGPRTPGGPNVPWQVNPPNLPMFQKGTAPFIGDYVDVTAAPNFILDATGKWTYNNIGTATPPIFHATWTDNRDVRPPLEDKNGDGNPWNDYTPPGVDGGMPSIFDPTTTVPQCIPGNAGSRNQNIYTARITGGLLTGSPGNTKRLGYRVDDSGNPTTELLQRSFVVFVQNTTEVTKRFRLTVLNQPAGGRASFDQFSALTAIEVELNRRSTASRTVYATSTDPHAMITVAVQELELVNGAWQIKQGGLGSNVVLNPDIDNPDIDNPDIDNPDIDNPDIDNAEVYNPDIDNPDIDNPDIDNPDIDNPDIDNPDIDNVRIMNPDIDNPDIDNPDIDNPDIDNPDIDNPDIDNPDIDNSSLMTDVNWTLTNTGNTTAAYNVNLFFAQQTFDPEIHTQLILYRTYKTPIVQNCVLKSETRNVLVANVPNPQLVKSSTGTVTDTNDPSATNATIYLAPGESAKITLRVFDPTPDPTKVVTVTNDDGTTAKISTAFIPNEDVTPVVQQQSVDTEDVDEGVTEPPIVVQFPSPETVEDTASTAENTPVKLNVLANDSTAFGSTKIISWHPAGMAAHSGSGPGDITFQPSTGFVYTQRGAVDPGSNALVGRFSLPPSLLGPPAGVIYQVANVRTGINYGRTAAPDTTNVTALDARPDSATFHNYLPMPALSGVPASMSLDAVHGLLYVVHGPAVASTTTPTTVSVIDVNPASGSFHAIVKTIALPVGLRAQAIAVSSRTQRVYVSTASPFADGANGGVYVFDGSAAAPVASRIANTSIAWGIAINESSNLVFAATAVGGAFALYVIDGNTNALTFVPTQFPMRFGSNDERIVVHEASGKVFMRLESVVTIFDGQRGSPTFATFLGAVNVGRDSNQSDIAVDQELGLVVTTGNVDFQIDIIDVASNALAETIPVTTIPTDVAIDPQTHRAFVSMAVSYVQEIDLTQQAATAVIPVFVESGSVLINNYNFNNDPAFTTRAYAGLFTTAPQLVKLSGAGLEGPIGDPGTQLPAAGRFLFSAWHEATNKGFIVNVGNQAGTGSSTGTVIVVDGTTDSVEFLGEVLPNPFGIAVDQEDDKIFVATLAGAGTHGNVLMADANDLDADPIESVGPGGAALPAGFNLSNVASLLSFGRHVVVNPATHRVYTLQTGGSPVSVVTLDPVTHRLTPLDGQAGTPIFDYLNASPCGGPTEPACNTFGRAGIIRVDASLNRIFIGFANGADSEIVVLDGSSHAVLGTLDAGSHSNRHTPSYIHVNEVADEFYVVDYNNDNIRRFNSATLAPIGAALTLADGPSAMAFNVAANRIYVSSVDSKTLTSIDAATMQIVSSVQLPLVAYFLNVDEVESRIYTSGGDSADESGTMIVTDVLGQLGTNVRVTSVGSAANGTVTMNADGSVTYTPDPGYSGPDQFTYNIEAPTGTAVGTVKITVVPSMPASIAFSDGYTVTSGQVLTVPAPGPLANDAVGAGTLEVSQVPQHGDLSASADGAFEYTPEPGYTGLDTFKYHVSTGAGPTNTVTVTINVIPAPSFVVTNTDNSGAGSLRAAINAANLQPSATITFAIPGAGPHTITTTSALPPILSPMTIDGYTQSGATANTGTHVTQGTDANIRVRLVGSGLPANTHGLQLIGGGATVKGLAIGNFSGNGIFIDVAGGNAIEGNFIGTLDGSTAAGNGGGGVLVQSSGNTIGGTTHAARNLISGNTGRPGVALQPRHQNGVLIYDASFSAIKGNLIGTNAAGTASLPNNIGIQVNVPDITIGGAATAERNVIAGNSGVGVATGVITFDADGGGP